MFVCDIGNPLPANQRASFGFKMTGTPDVDVSREFIEVKMSANSTNPEAEGSEQDNDMVLHIPVEIKAQLNLMGR